VINYLQSHSIEKRSREILDGLQKRGFKTTLGDDDSGFLLMAWNKGGGYYLGWSICGLDVYALTINDNIRRRSFTDDHRWEDQTQERRSNLAFYAERFAFRRRFYSRRGRGRLCYWVRFSY